jgi:Holliday junction DNA helicase RuvA
MIEFIAGTIDYVEDTYVAVEQGGVGYQIFVSHPERFTEQETVRLYTHQVVREDLLHLYGFLSREERDLFRLLLDVSGIGPKAGLAIMANQSPKQFVQAIHQENLKVLTQIPGIGKKTAQRMIIELRDKLIKQPKFAAIDSPPVTADEGAVVSQEVIAALVGLGYNEEEAQTFVHAVAQEQTSPQTIEDWIKRALQVAMNQ